MLIKNRFKESKEKKDHAIADLLGGMVASVRQRFNLDPKIEALNRWCREHPRRMFGLYVAVVPLVTFLALVAGTVFAPGAGIDTDMPGQQIISTIRSANAVRDKLADDVNELVIMAQNDIREIDSLMSLPAMTCDDSLKVMQASERLRIFNQTFNNNED